MYDGPEENEDHQPMNRDFRVKYLHSDGFPAHLLFSSANDFLPAIVQASPLTISVEVRTLNGTWTPWTPGV